MVTEGGLPTMASTHLCGVPSYDVSHEDIGDKIDAFWDRLIRADDQNFIIMAASPGQGEIEDELGIISGHAYSLISAHEITTEDE